MSQFDPQAFLDAQLTAPSTRRPPLPAGSDFVGVIGQVKPRSWNSRDGTRSGIALDVPIRIDLSAYPDLGEAFKGTDAVMLVDSIMLDLTENGSIDNSPGKNSKLRRYREALNMNKPGDIFSPRQMEGRQIKVKISWREYEGEKYDQVDSIARA